MLNLLYAYEDSCEALLNYGTYLDIPSLVPTVYMMQRDVINHYRHSLEHYFTISLNEHYLQDSSLGSPYQKWAYFVNENHKILSLTIRNLLMYTSRLVHESECKGKIEQRNIEDIKDLSNTYTGPILESQYDDKPIGIMIHQDERLTVNWIRTEPRPERVKAVGRAGEPTRYYLIDKDSTGRDVKYAISLEDFNRYIESISQSEYDISDRSVLNDIKDAGLKEITNIEALNDRYGVIAENYMSSNKVCLPYSSLNQSYWT